MSSQETKAKSFAIVSIAIILFFVFVGAYTILPWYSSDLKNELKQTKELIQTEKPKILEGRRDALEEGRKTREEAEKLNEVSKNLKKDYNELEKEINEAGKLIDELKNEVEKLERLLCATRKLKDCKS